MNPMEILLNHKTIRQYKKQNINPAHVQALIDVAKRTATSMGLQHYSIIRITDDALKNKLAVDICKQPYIADVPEVFIFVVDCYRNAKIAQEAGAEVEAAGDSDRFFQGWTDACLAAQNMVAAAELAGFGTIYMGSILNDAAEVIKLLGLPPLTFPVVGVGIGVADQQPQLKPRMPRELNVFENAYKNFADYHYEFEEYDAEMENYYDTRMNNRRSDKFTKQVVDKLKMVNEKRSNLFAIIAEQGFKI